MRLASFRYGDRNLWGVERADGLLPAVSILGAQAAESIVALLNAPDNERRHQLSVLDAADTEAGLLLDPSDVDWQAPIPHPVRNIFCIGVNYRDHVEESLHSTQQPSAPVFFTKATTSVSGHQDIITVDPALTRELDWEVELGVIIGRGGRGIAAADALEHVFGYTVINDLSARDVQHNRPEHQWFLGKSLDGTCPMGPVIVTAAAVADPHDLELRLTVNDVVKQTGTTNAMIFDIAAAIEDLSRYITLLPGDVIATGTPAGVGGARTPPEFLSDGDVVEASVQTIGTLTTTLRFGTFDESRP